MWPPEWAVRRAAIESASDTSAPPAQGTQSLERALALLDAIAQEPTRAMGLAGRLDIPRPTVIRMLGVLERHRYVTRGPDDAYYLGTRPLELTEQWHRQVGLARLVAPALDDFVERFRETAFACLRDGTESLCIAGRESTRAVRFGLSLGARTALYAGAFSKTILAYAPNHVLDSVLEGGLAPLTERTITDPARLRADLAKIRRQGIAETNGEADEGVTSIAAPVILTNQEAAAIGVALPTARATAETRTTIRECVLMYADRITESLIHSARPVRLPAAKPPRRRRSSHG